jgi:hypothetical protein
MNSKTRTLVLTAATVLAASLATSADCFAVTALPDPWPESNVACVGRMPFENKTFIVWGRGGGQFPACIWQQIGNETALFDDYIVQGKAGNDQLKIGCTILCGATNTTLEANVAWGGHYIDLDGGDGHDRLSSWSSNGSLFVDSWFFGGPGNDWLTSFSSMGRLLAGGGNDTIESTSQFATNEWLDGGDNDDCLKANGVSTAYFNCGPGTDSFATFTSVNQNCENLAWSCPIPSQ